MSENKLPPLDIAEFQVPFVFRSRPVSIPADLRPTWRIGLIILLLNKCCRKGKSSLTRLHVLSWGFVSADGRAQLLAAAAGTLSPDSIVVRFEPFLLQAVDYAIGEGLVRRTDGGTIELIETGKRLAAELEADKAVYATEKSVMESIRMRITEKLVQQMFGWRQDA